MSIKTALVVAETETEDQEEHVDEHPAEAAHGHDQVLLTALLEGLFIGVGHPSDLTKEDQVCAEES